MRNLRVATIGSGVFSKFYIGVSSVLEKTLRLTYDIDRITFEIDYEGTPDHWRDATPPFEDGTNPFDLVLDQDVEDLGDVITGGGGVRGGSLYQDFLMPRLRSICSCIKIHDDVLNRLHPINERTLGVHIRLTDMNGEDESQFVLDDYIKAIEKVRHDYDTMFVACDNHESLQNLHQDFMCNDVVRYPRETASDKEFLDYYIENCSTSSLWYDSFLEMASLSRCGGMIYRRSSLNWAAMCFGSPEMKLYPLNTA